MLGNLPMIAGTDILKATTISGTMVIGLAPAFLFSRHVGCSPASFHLSFWTGMLLGVLLALQGPASQLGDRQRQICDAARRQSLQAGAVHRGLPAALWLLRGPGPQVPGVRHECHRGTRLPAALPLRRRPLPRPPSGRRKRSTSSAASTAISQLLKRSSRSPMPSPARSKLCFNGDFNWFDTDDQSFAAINRTVLPARRDPWKRRG